MEVRSGWTTTYNRRVPSLTNVMPEEDIIEHVPGIRCVCSPHYERVRSGPHVLGRIVIHCRVG